MTLEQRAEAILDQFSLSDNALAYFAVEHVLQFADAEAAAMRERAAECALHPGFIEARDTEWDEGVNYAKRYIAAAIRALPATGEVGRG